MAIDDSSQVIVGYRSVLCCLDFFMLPGFLHLERYRTGTEGIGLDLDSLKVLVSLEIAADSHLPRAESLTFNLRVLVLSHTELKMPFDSSAIIFCKVLFN